MATLVRDIYLGKHNDRGFRRLFLHKLASVAPPDTIRIVVLGSCQRLARQGRVIQVFTPRMMLQMFNRAQALLSAAVEIQRVFRGAVSRGRNRQALVSVASTRRDITTPRGSEGTTAVCFVSFCMKMHFIEVRHTPHGLRLWYPSDRSPWVVTETGRTSDSGEDAQRN